MLCKFELLIKSLYLLSLLLREIKANGSLKDYDPSRNRNQLD